MANVQLTKDAIEKLNQEAECLKGSKRAELQEGIEVAKKLSDAEQKEAHDEYAKNESRIAVLEELIDGTFQREAANQTRTAQPVRVTLESSTSCVPPNGRRSRKPSRLRRASATFRKTANTTRPEKNRARSSPGSSSWKKCSRMWI